MLEREKQDNKFKYVRELANANDENARNETNLQFLHDQELTSLKKQHEQIVDELKQDSKTSLSRQKEQLTAQLFEEREKIVLEKDEVIKAKEAKLSELQNLYDESSNKIATLSGQVQQSEVGLGSASSRITRLNEMMKEKQAKINSLLQELEASRTLVTNLKV